MQLHKSGFFFIHNEQIFFSYTVQYKHLNMHVVQCSQHIIIAFKVNFERNIKFKPIFPLERLVKGGYEDVDDNFNFIWKFYFFTFFLSIKP